MIHRLKIERPFLAALLEGSKTFEVRVNDRGYQAGDILQFWDVDEQAESLWDVTYVLTGYAGIADGYAILAVRRQP